jgi:predicted Zn-dependent protease
MKKKTIIKFSALLATGAVLLGICWPAYRHYRETLALRTARKFMARGDYRNASLSARRLLLLNPGNVEGCRMLGQLAEPTDSAEALEWYERIVELRPTIDDKLELAARALRLQEPPYQLAAQTLAEMAGSATGRVSYCVLSAELALKLGKANEAEKWFESARGLQPGNELHRLNLAVLRLQSTNIAMADEARATLYRMRASKSFSTLVLRSLISDAMTRHALNAAENLSSELLTHSDALLDDHLRQLDILHAARSSELTRSLGLLQHRAATNAAEMAAVSAWMVDHGQAREAIAWLTNATPAMREQPSVRLATVECSFALGDWPGAEAFLKAQKWEELEPMRLAFLSRAASEQHNAVAADLQWRLAVNQAQKRLGSLMWLSAKAAEWNREGAKEEVLWQIAQQFPSQRWALRELADLAQARGRTRDLHRVYGRMVIEDPRDPVAQNNFAATGLLLKIDLEKAHETASALFSQHPTEPIIASTYAYSLHFQKRTTDGLAALEKLPADQLTNPPIALYYGVLLRADGQTERARQYLKLAESAALLPEERRLLQQGLKDL